MNGLTLSDTSYVSLNKSFLTSGQVGYWNLDEGSGTTTVDASGNGWNGTLVNSPTWATGYFKNGLTFNGTSTRIDAGTFSWTSTDITIAAWVKRPWTTAKYAPILTIGYNITSGIGMLIAGSAGGQWVSSNVILVGNGYNNTPCASGGLTNTFTPNTWHHIAGVLSNNIAQIYIDGVAVSMFNISKAPIPNISGQTLRIGGEFITGDWMDGTLDDVRLYNRVLTPNEILNLYNYIP